MPGMPATLTDPKKCMLCFVNWESVVTPKTQQCMSWPGVIHLETPWLVLVAGPGCNCSLTYRFNC